MRHGMARPAHARSGGPRLSTKIDKSVVPRRHHAEMAQPATPHEQPNLHLSMIEARMRFTQLIRLAHLNQQTVTVTEAGRPLAVIAPISACRASATAPPNNS